MFNLLLALLMKKLSAEVISIIFKYLHYKQKVECMLVCRAWANILRSGLDIETVIITPSQSLTSSPKHNGFTLFMEKIKTYDDYGKHCKRLAVDESSPQVFDYGSLASHFPNLTYLSLNGDDETEDFQSKPLTMIQHKQLQSWKNNLKEANVLKYSRRFLDYLDAGVFTSLTKLVLSPCNEFSYQFLSSIFEKLKSAPRIETFSIERLHIDICDLEELHNSLPKLISLTLKKCFLHCRRSAPIDIQTADTLKSLSIYDFLPSFDVSTSITQYLIIKYGSIKNLAMKTPIYSRDDGRFNQVANDATPFIHGIGQNLTGLDLDLAFKTPTVFNTFKKVCLKHLSARIFLSKRLFNNLVSLNGLQHIQTLKLSQVPHLDFEVFKRFSELTELELEFKEKRGAKFAVELNTIINRYLPKKLESLGLGYVELHINTDQQEHLDTRIKQLKLNRSEVSEKLTQYLDRHMKLLRNLFLYDCKVGFIDSDDGNLQNVAAGAANPCFKLPNHRLNLVHIFLSTSYSYSYSDHAYQETYENPVNLKLEIGDTSTRYFRPPESNCRNRNGLSLNIQNIHDRALHKICKSEPFNENKKYFCFSCKDVQTIYFDRYLAL